MFCQNVPEVSGYKANSQHRMPKRNHIIHHIYTLINTHIMSKLHHVRPKYQHVMKMSQHILNVNHIRQLMRAIQIEICSHIAVKSLPPQPAILNKSYDHENKCNRLTYSKFSIALINKGSLQRYNVNICKGISTSHC